MEHVEPGRSIDCHITRDGDLIHRVYFEYENNNQQYYPANFGNYMIQKVDLLIGGQLIDSHPGHWLEVYSRLTQPQYGLNPKMSEKNESSGSYIQSLSTIECFGWCIS